MVGDPRGTVGKLGETLACRELERRGYAILDRRYRTRGGEIDIVARDGQTIVFVEVKTRRQTAFGQPVEAVTWLKQRRLLAMARDYLAHRRLGRLPCRFDVVSVLWLEDKSPVVDIIPHAFDADGW